MMIMCYKGKQRMNRLLLITCLMCVTGVAVGAEEEHTEKEHTEEEHKEEQEKDTHDEVKEKEGKEEESKEKEAKKADKTVKKDETKKQDDTKKKQDEVDDEKEPEMGLDTVSHEGSQGNWLFKRIWWEKAEEKYEKIRQYVESIFESRALFITKRADIDKLVLDPLYVSLGFGQLELTHMLDKWVDHLEKEWKKDELPAEKQQMLTELKPELDMIKSMKVDADGIELVNNQINESLEKLFDLIKKIRGYERSAWNNFKDIARIFDDAKARVAYYEIRIIGKNIASVQAYIQQEFTAHFEQLEEKITQQVAHIEESLAHLKEKNIDLSERLVLFEQKQIICPVAPAETDKDQKKEHEEEVETGGFIDSYIIAPIHFLFTGITSVIDGIIGLLTGKDSGEETAELPKN